MKPLVTFLLIAIAFLSGCKKNETASNGSAKLSIYLTDDPMVNVDQLLVDIQGLEVKVEDDGVDSLGGWFRLNIRSGVYDILKFRNGLDTLFATGQIPSGRKLQKLRLILGNNNSVVVNGQRFTLVLHNGETEVIVKLEGSVIDELVPGQLRFWIDFDANRSVQQKSGQYVLRSQLKIFSKGRSGEIEGRVLPAEAKPMIMAINGSDTATAKPDQEGEFRIVGLSSGTYQLFIHPTANNYRDTTINDIIVTHGEDTKLATIQLSR